MVPINGHQPKPRREVAGLYGRPWDIGRSSMSFSQIDALWATIKAHPVPLYRPRPYK